MMKIKITFTLREEDGGQDVEVLWDRVPRVGDRVQLLNAEGTVKSVTWSNHGNDVWIELK